MRLAKHCENPEYRQALKGDTINSIKASLKLISSLTPKKQQPFNPDDPKLVASFLRSEIKNKLAEELRDLPFEILEIFDDNFEGCFDASMIYLSHIARKKLHRDPDKILLKKIQRKIKDTENRYNQRSPRRRWSTLRQEGAYLAKLDYKRQRIKDRMYKKAVLHRIRINKKRRKQRPIATERALHRAKSA